MATAKIINFPELVGSKVTACSAWADGDSFSIAFDNGTILQISADPINKREARVRWELERE